MNKESLTLDSLVASLEESVGMIKQAEDANTTTVDAKNDPEVKEKKKEEDVKADIDKAKKAVDDAGKEIEDAKKENGKEQQTKEAQLQGAALAKEVMSKLATLNSNTKPNKETEMKKEAAEVGKALADALLQKIADANDVNTNNGVTAGTVPQMNIANGAQMVSEDDQKVQPMPTGDGITNAGTVNQILEGIVGDAIAQGAVSSGGGVDAAAKPISQVEDCAQTMATPNQVPVLEPDEVEKAAAVSALVQDGFDFDSAIEMVKAAAEEIEYEENQQIKQAAIGALLDRGVDFDTAVDMVKKAAIGDMIADAGKAVANYGKAVATDARKIGTQVHGVRNTRGPLQSAFKRELVSNKALRAGAGIIGAGAGIAGASALMARRNQEKQAALSALTEAGIDFDAAVDLVDDQATRIYGA